MALPADCGARRTQIRAKDDMTTLLQQAIAAIEKLPKDAQDAIAARFLAETADEQAWEERFQATTDADWEHLADGARRSIAGRSTTSLGEAFPPPRP